MIFEQNSSMALFRKTTPVTFTLMIIVTSIFLVQIFTGDLLIKYAALSSYRVANEGEYWRLFTVMFLHADVIHFLFNTFFGLFLISSALERLIGPVKFAILYFASGIGASIVVVLWDVFTQSPSIGVGASGAIYGVLGALLYFTIYKKEWFNPQDISSIRGLILINVIFTFMVANVSTTAHLGGLVAGFLITAIINPKRYIRGAKKGFQDPYDPYSHENQRPKSYDYVDIVDDDEDDDDDDRRIW